MPEPTKKQWFDPARFEEKRAYLEARARIARSVRGYFDSRDFVEVDTPALQVSPGLEPHLKSFATRLHEPFGGEHTLYLHTSPEFAMKKLLAAGMPRIYQLAHAYRNAERSALHHPEFTMLEWYRAPAPLSLMVDECIGVVRAAGHVAGGQPFRRGGEDCNVFTDFEQLSVAQAFARDADIDLLDVLDEADDSGEPDPAKITAEARRINVACQDHDRFEDVFFRILLSRIEPRLGKSRGTVLYDYPLCLSALAKANPSDSRLAERFEIYVCGVELANGCVEVTDARELRRRFSRDAAVKQRLYGESHPADDDFLAAMERLPDCAGVALGFDRLVMLATGAPSIDDVLWAPVADFNR